MGDTVEISQNGNLLRVHPTKTRPDRSPGSLRQPRRQTRPDQRRVLTRGEVSCRYRSQNVARVPELDRFWGDWMDERPPVLGAVSGRPPSQVGRRGGVTGAERTERAVRPANRIGKTIPTASNAGHGTSTNDVGTIPNGPA